MSRNCIQERVSNKIGATRVVSLTSRVVVVFAIFILVSSFATNFINLYFNRAEYIKVIKELLVKDFRTIYDDCNIQYQIYEFNKAQPDALQKSVAIIKKKAIGEFKNQKSIAFALKRDGSLFFFASKFASKNVWHDPTVYRIIQRNRRQGFLDGTLTFHINHEEYFGVYKYNPKWDIYLIRAEEFNEFYEGSRRILRNISILIAIFTGICTLAGVVLIRRITRHIKMITGAIMEMTQKKQLAIVDLKDAANDDITFLGAAFNSLSSTINNLLTIFRKFVNQDVVLKAYAEKEIRLEGTQRELTILFSDIKSFTFMTETLGPDIIILLNLHYHRAIHAVLDYQGIIGSIIGDALLAVYGVPLDLEAVEPENKSYQAVLSGYRIHEMADSLRAEMTQRRDQIISQYGQLSDEEEKIYQAVFLEVGIGIDGGNVFYGNIGSHERMTNTVIGDNVNSASRLESLTRVYKVPIICSEYVKDDIENNVPAHGLYFQELDQVQVKGQTIGRKIYWPIWEKNLNDSLRNELAAFSQGLKLYYKGEWDQAYRLFAQSRQPLVEVFQERTRERKPPENWSGIWTMTNK